MLDQNIKLLLLRYLQPPMAVYVPLFNPTEGRPAEAGSGRKNHKAAMIPLDLTVRSEGFSKSPPVLLRLVRVQDTKARLRVRLVR